MQPSISGYSPGKEESVWSKIDMKTEHTVLVSLTRNCAKTKDLTRGCNIHADLLRRGMLEKSPYIVDALVNMYAKCGSLLKAQLLLFEFHVRSVFSWTALLSGCVQHGQAKLALVCFEWMQHEGLSPDAITFASMLRACGNLGAIDKGCEIHNEISQHGLLENDPVLGNALVDMYARCGALAKAAGVLKNLPNRDIVSWNSLMAGYTQNGRAEDALKCMDDLGCDGLIPDHVTFTYALKACGILGEAVRGRELHDEISKEGLLETCHSLGNALVDMYAKCGAFQKARQVLNELLARDVISWNALIAGYTQHCQGEEALECLESMQREGISPDVITFTCVLKACSSMCKCYKGEQIHVEVTKQGLLGEDVMLGNALVAMYAKCGAVAKAHKVLEELDVQNTVSWNALIAGYVQQEQGHNALKCFEQMQCQGLSPDEITFANALKACSSIGAVAKGEQIHDEIVRQELLQNNVVLGNALLDMYVKCGELSKAEHVLEELPIQSVVTWNTLLAGYANEGKVEKALNCFDQMELLGFVPDTVTFACILKVCGLIGEANKGEELYQKILKQGSLEENLVLGNALVDMFAKCGALKKAEEVFEKLPVRDEVSWNALITGYGQQGQPLKALNCFELMQLEGLSPNAITYTCILKACGLLEALMKGEQIHFAISRQGLIKEDDVLANALVDMYVKCGALAKAQQAVKDLHTKNATAWNLLIAEFVQQGNFWSVIDCFEQMQHEGFCPDAITYCNVLKACGFMKASSLGKRIHTEIARCNFLGEDEVLSSSLVEMYIRLGSVSMALEVLGKLTVVDTSSWNVLISGYIQLDETDIAFFCFKRMLGEGLLPDELTFACILKACGAVGAIDLGERIQIEIVLKGMLDNDVVLCNSLVDMYVKCRAFDKAQKVLKESCADSVVSWNSVIAGYAQEGEGFSALDCFHCMQQKGHSADAVTYTSVLKACGSIEAKDKGEEIHDEIVKKGLLETNIELGNALVDMYTKFGDLKKARLVLEDLPVRNPVTWNTLILGYANQGQGQNALVCFEQMKDEGFLPDAASFLCILKACSIIGAVIRGQEIHTEIARLGLLDRELALGNALVDMYAKCGALTRAHQVLAELPLQDVVSWNTLMAGYANQGRSQECLSCLSEMASSGVSPDKFTFSSVLSACSHAGQIDEVERWFYNMVDKYKIKPAVEHSGCMVDLFGRTGNLEKAVACIEKMQSASNPVILSMLLGACQRWGDVSVAQWAFQMAVKVDKNDAGY